MLPIQRTGVLIILLMAFLCGCSADSSPVSAPEDQTVALQTFAPDNAPARGNRYLWGFWEVQVSERHDSADVIPLRIAEMHFNAVRMLEEWPCSDCLTIGNLQNADGYTALFNPTDFPPDEPGPAALKYIPGQYARGNLPTATLNPFLSYAQGAPRAMFEPGDTKKHAVMLRLPSGAFSFGYAVDFCWQKPDIPVSDPVTDFAAEANCLEAYRLEVSMDEDLLPLPGSPRIVSV